MPVVIASMLTATNEPRTFAGTSSAIYIGEINEAMPMAIPLTILAAINQATVGARAVPMALTVKIMPANNDHFAATKAAGQSASHGRADNGAD